MSSSHTDYIYVIFCFIKHKMLIQFIFFTRKHFISQSFDHCLETFLSPLIFAIFLSTNLGFEDFFVFLS